MGFWALNSLVKKGLWTSVVWTLDTLVHEIGFWTLLFTKNAAWTHHPLMIGPN